MSSRKVEPNWQELPLREAYPFGSDHGLENEVSAIRDNRSYRSWMRRGFIAELFRNREMLQSFIDTCWPHGKTPDGKRLIQRYLSTAANIRETEDDLEDDDSDEPFAQQRFAHESNLRDFLADHLDIIEPDLRLFEDDDKDGVEYSIGGGRIDILAVDQTDRFVVIELKVSRGRNPTVGQILHYMAWVDDNLSGSETSRGIILAKTISDDLRLACQRTPDISLYEYDMSVRVQKV